MFGIDLGTSNSCVAEFKNGAAQMVKNALGGVITPTYVAFTNSGVEIGDVAKNGRVLRPDSTFYSTKRLIGRRFDEFEVQEQRARVSYEIINKDGLPFLKTPGGLYSPTDLAAAFLRQLAKDFGSKDVVVTVPAYFNNYYKEETHRAAELAGLRPVRLLAEPTAAALAYDFSSQNRRKNEVLLVVDLGAGTFDVSVVNKASGIYQVVSSAGDNFFGGDDYTAAVFDFLVCGGGRAGAKDAKDADYSQYIHKMTPTRRSELLELSELCKLSLSRQSQFTAGDFNINIYYYEKLVQHLDDRLSGPIQRALSDANLQASYIDRVVLVGGQTKQPSVQRKIAQIVGKAQIYVIDPDLSVAKGAAVQHAIIKYYLNSLLLLDVTSHSLGIETLGGAFSVVIPRNAPIPTRQTQIFTTTEDGQESVRISVFQGERALASANYLLGQFTLKNIQKAAKGVPRIEVTFEINYNGLIKIAARDVASGIKYEIAIERPKEEAKESQDRSQGGQEKAEEGFNEATPNSAAFYSDYTPSEEQLRADREEIERTILRKELKDLGAEIGEETDLRALRALKSRFERRQAKNASKRK